MEYNGLQKQTNLTSRDKIAILFGELGASGSKEMLKYFSTKEIKQIRKALEKTPNFINVNRENKVLEETMDYGLRHRITPMDPVKMEDAYYVAQERENKRNDFRDGIMQNADSVANILKMWLDSDDK